MSKLKLEWREGSRVLRQWYAVLTAKRTLRVQQAYHDDEHNGMWRNEFEAETYYGDKEAAMQAAERHALRDARAVVALLTKRRARGKEA